jgi:hypothetical protein
VINITQKTAQDPNFSVIGVLDEDFRPESINAVNSPQIVFDFKELKGINSCGIRSWITMLEKQLAGKKVIYLNCPSILVQQINLVQGLLPKNGEIHTFMAPYFCEKCDKEYSVLISAKDIQGLKAPEVKCPSDASVMDFDAIEKQFFTFLRK